MNLINNKFIAHRGLHKDRLIPENSLIAFNEAVLNNYAIEFDINITNDNKIVVFHDDNLFRLCNIDKQIEDTNFSFLKDLSLYETKEKIPLFDEVLDLVSGKVDLIIEIKKHKNIGILENILFEKLEKYQGKYLVCSFETNILFWMRNNKKEKIRGLIFESYPSKFEKYNKSIFLYKFYKTKPHFISLDEKLVDSSIYDFCKIKNLQIIFWTIRTKKRFDEIKQRVDGIIFENLLIEE